MASGELVSNLRRIPLLLGRVLTMPDSALREISRRGTGGFWLLVSWCLLAAIGLRFTNLVDALLGFDAGGGLQLLSVLVGELSQAVPIALITSLTIVVFAGDKRDPGVDLELGCAAALPFLFTRAVFRTGVVLTAVEPPALGKDVSYAVAAAWTLLVVVKAVRVARARPLASVSETPAIPARARVVGWAALGVLGLALAGSALWTFRNAGALGPVSKGAAAPDFKLPRVDGTSGALSLSSYRGRVVVLDFWATWCPPCIASLPTMHELSRELAPKGVTFIGVDSDGAQSSPAEVEAFLRSHGAPYPVVYDDGTANEQYRIKVLPTVVIVGREGNIRRVLIGTTSKKALTAAIESAAN